MRFTSGKRLENGHHLIRVLRERMAAGGKIVIVAEKPSGLMSVLRRQWNRQIAYEKLQFSRTLDSTKRSELKEKIEKMQQLSFSSRNPLKSADKDVIISNSDDAILYMPQCSTLVITTKIPHRELDTLSAFMLYDGEVIVFE